MGILVQTSRPNGGSTLSRYVFWCSMNTVAGKDYDCGLSILHSTCETQWGQNNMGLVDIVHVAYGASLKKGAHRRYRSASNFLWVVMHTYYVGLQILRFL